MIKERDSETRSSSINKYLNGHRWLLYADGALTEKDIYGDYLSFCAKRGLEIYGYVPFAEAMRADIAWDNKARLKRQRFKRT